MKDFSKYLGLGGGVGIAVSLYIVAGKLTSEAVSVLVGMIVFAVAIAIVSLPVAYIVIRARKNFDITPEPTYSIQQPAISPYTDFKMLNAPERKWEFKDGSDRHLQEVNQSF